MTFVTQFLFCYCMYMNKIYLFHHWSNYLIYFQGLVQSKQKPTSESSNNSSLTEEMAAVPMTTEKISEYLPKDDEEACPICQEKLNNQKMVFPCGHVTCCKCEFYLFSISWFFNFLKSIHEIIMVLEQQTFSLPTLELALSCEFNTTNIDKKKQMTQ